MLCLELVATYISTNLAENAKACLNKQWGRKIYAWLDSTTVLLWIKIGDYKTVVSNSLSKIKGNIFYLMNIGYYKENPRPSWE